MPSLLGSRLQAMQQAPLRIANRHRAQIQLAALLLLALPLQSTRTLADEVPQANPSNADRYGDPLPMGVLRRYGTVRFRHEGEVTCITYSPSGLRLATADTTGSVSLWRASTGTLLRRVTLPHRNVHGLVFSPDGKAVAAAASDPGSSRVYVLKCDTGAPVFNLDVDGDVFGSRIAYSPDGQCLATSDRRRGIELWDTSRGQVVPRQSLGDQIRALQFSSDGRWLAAGTSTGTLRLWETTRDMQLQSVETGLNYVNTIAFTPDSQQIVAGGSIPTGGPPRAVATAAVYCWDTSTLADKRSIGVEPGTSSALDLAVAANGRTLTTITAEKLFVTDLEHDECRRVLARGPGPLNGDVGKRLALSRDGSKLAATVNRNSNSICIWDVASGLRVDAVDGHGGPLIEAMPIKQGEQVVTTSEDGTVRYWDATTAQPVRSVKRHALAICPATGRIAATSIQSGETIDPVIRIVDPMTNKTVEYLVVGRRLISSARFSPDGAKLAVASYLLDDFRRANRLRGEFRIQVFDLATAEEIGSAATSSSVESLGFSGDGQRRAGVESSGRIYVWDTEKVGVARQMWDSLRGQIAAVALSPDGERLAITTRTESLVYIMSVATRELASAVALPGPNANSLAWSHDGRVLAAAAGGDWIGAWEVETSYGAMRLRRPKSEIISLSFSSAGNSVLSAMSDGSALLWPVARAGSNSTGDDHDSDQ